MHLHMRDGDGFEVPLLQPGQLQHAQGFVVQRDGAWRHEDAGLAVHDQRVHAIAAQQIGQRGPGRPEADDQYVHG